MPAGLLFALTGGPDAALGGRARQASRLRAREISDGSLRLSRASIRPTLADGLAMDRVLQLLEERLKLVDPRLQDLYAPFEPASGAWEAASEARRPRRS